MADWDPFERADSFHEDVSSAVMVAVPEQPPTENVQPCGPSGDSTNDVAAKGWSERVPFTYADYNSTEFTEWAGSAKRYEWSDEYGDVGPKNEELEKQLFNVENMTHAGLKLDRLNKIDVRTESEERVCPVTNWEDAGLHPIVKENISLCLYAAPTAIQMYAIPAMLMDKDLIAISQTGSGKTGAYLIPILSKLMGKAKKLAAPRPNAVEVNFNPKTDGVRAEPLVLVVCPTRELATQIFDDARRLCYRSMLRPCVAYGGVPSRLQREELQRGCDILIGTPGRIIDFMGQGHVLSLRRVKFTVVDEADELLHADWEDDFKKIMSGGDATEDDDHRYMMFSATFNKECRMLARDYLGTNHIRIRIGRPGSSHLNVEQQVIYVEDAMKNKALYDLLLSMCPIRTLVFVNSKAQVDYVDDYLYNAGLPSTSIHGDRTQREREDAIRAFKTAKCPIMVATGLSARGLDIANIMHVVNYDLPKAVHGGITEYVHRIGRTARIGNEGLATSFYSDKDKDIAFDLVKILLECDQKVPEFLQDYTPTDNCPVFADDDTDVETDQDEDDQDEEKQDKVNQDGNDTWGQSSASVGEQQAPFAPENTSRNNGIGGSNWATAGVTL